MNLELRAAWLSASWLVCAGAAQGALGWGAVIAMAVGAWLMPEPS